MLTERDFNIWVAGWQVTFISAGRSIDSCNEWLKSRLIQWGEPEWAKKVC